MEKADTEDGSVHSSGAATAQNLASGVLSQSEPEKSSSSETSRVTDSKHGGGVARKRYTREDLLNARNSKLVRDSPISLESEIFRELQVDNFFEQNAQPSSARAIQGNQQIGPQDPPVWKDDSWRAGNRFKSPAIAGSPPTGLPPKSRLVDDGPLAGSPDKEKPPGATGPPGGMGPPQRGLNGPGWRRSNEWRPENDEGHEGWRPGNRQNSVQREEGGERRPNFGNNEEGWRPPPPGLGRANSRGVGPGGGAPPGLGSNGEQWEKPWGAGRGRLLDGERRLNGKPRDPPGIMPPRENTREPGVKAQLPEGWNKPNNRDEWRNGAKGKVWEDKTARQSSDGTNPSWMAAEPEEAEGDTSLLEQRRAEVEAERKAMQEERERERQAKMSAAKSDPGQDLIADEEIEAMKLEQQEEERRERIAEVTKTEAAKPPRPASAQAGSLDFNVDSLFAGTQNGPGSAVGRGEDAPDLGSRFGRWFQLESSPSAPTALPPTDPQGAGLPQPGQGQGTPAPQQAGEQSFLQQQQQQQQPSASEAAQFQQYLASQTQNPGQQQQELPRGLLAQLQGGGGASNGSLSSLGQGAQGQGQGQAPGQPGWPRTLTDMERAMLERQLMSPQNTPRDAMGMPIQQQQSPQQQQQQAQAQFANNPNNALLQLLQGQQQARAGSVDPKLAQQREPTFANPNPQMTAQQQQQLMNSLGMGGQQGNQQQQANLLEQLQQLRFAQAQSQQNSQMTQQQQAQLQAQQVREREQQQFAQLRQQLALQQQQQQQAQGQGQAQNPLLAAFSAQMPRETGLGVGRGDRPQGMSQQQQSNLAHLLQQNPQFAHNLRQQAQASQAASNAFSGAPYGFSSAGGGQMGGLGQNAGINQYGARQAPQPSFTSQGPGMGSAEAHSVARYIEQQRALEAANHHAHQQKLLQQHRLFQMQQLAAQQQQREANQRAAAHAALLQQQQQQQHAASLGSRLTPAEAVLRQQQMLQFQALNLGGGNQARGVPQADTDALARFLSQQGSSGLNNLGGRPL